MKRAIFTALFLLVGGLLWACGSETEPPELETSDQDTLELADELETELPDPCEEVVECEAEGPRCVGSKLEVCAKDVNGCVLVSRTVDCSLAQYGDCDPSATGGANCVVRSPCDGITNCSVLGSSCAGDEVLKCSLDDLGCRVETREDCSLLGTSCVLDGIEARCGFDPCANVSTPCEAPSRQCDGQTLELCTRNVYGCLGEKLYPCQALGGRCDLSGTIPACIVPEGCKNITPCLAEGSACDGSQLVTCKRNEYGCLAETRANCTQTEVGFGYCDAGRGTPSCAVTFNTSCEQFVTCSNVDRRCEDDVLVDCSVNGFACLVETRTDCRSLGQVCHTSGPVVGCVDPCSLVNTCEAEVICSGNVLVNCSRDENNCLVPMEYKDCATLAQVCNPSLTPPECDAPPFVNLSATVNATIPGNSSVNSTLSVSTVCAKVKAITVDVNIQHSWIGDLQVSLKSPNNTTVKLHDESGGSADNIVGTYPTTLTPAQSLSSFLNQPAQGSWVITVTETYYSSQGSFKSWGLNIECGS